MWKQFLKQILNEKIQKPSLLYGQLCEQARWIESYPVIGYPSGQDGAILPAQDYMHVSCKKNFSESHIINPSSTKLIRLRWLDIGFVLFFVSLWTSTVSVHKHSKKGTWPKSSHLDLTLYLQPIYIAQGL